MNLKKEFNRLTGMFDDSRDKWSDMADDLRYEARHMAKRARKSLSHGKDRLASTEEMVTRAMRERPQFFVVAVICLLAMIVVKVVMDQSERDDEMYQ